MEQFACTIQRLLSVDNFSANQEGRGLFTRYAFTYIINIRVIYGYQLLTPDTIEDSLLYVARIDSYTCYHCTISQSILFPYFTLYFYNDNDLLYCELLCRMEPFLNSPIQCIHEEICFSSQDLSFVIRQSFVIINLEPCNMHV